MKIKIFEICREGGKTISRDIPVLSVFPAILIKAIAIFEQI